MRCIWGTSMREMFFSQPRNLQDFVVAGKSVSFMRDGEMDTQMRCVWGICRKCALLNRHSWHMSLPDLILRGQRTQCWLLLEVARRTVKCVGHAVFHVVVSASSSR